jgi:hypothetical protein
MEIEQAFGKLIMTNAAVLLQCPAARVFAPAAPQSQQTWPCVAYRTVPPVVRDPVLGPSGYTGLVRTRLRVFVSGKGLKSYGIVKRLNKAVQKALLGFQGLVEDDTVSPVEAVEIQGIFAHSTFNVDDYDQKADVVTVFSDYDVWHDE